MSRRNAKKTYWILALDGGGIRGLFTSMILTKIQGLMGKPLHRQFDMFVGTSIGGLISLTLAQAHRKDVKQNLISLFSQKNMHRIFDVSLWDEIMPVQFKPKYDGKGKREVIGEHLYVETLGELCGKTAVVTYNIEKEKTRVFRSWADEDSKVNLLSVGDATSAAPIYFPAVNVSGEWYIDGGIAANNPCLVALREGMKLWGHDADIRVLSIGTGQAGVKRIGKEAKDWGAVEWVLKGQIIDKAMDAPRDVMWKCCRDILPEGRFLRVNGIVPEEAMDDTTPEFRDALEKCARRVFEENKHTIQMFLNGNTRTSPVCPQRSITPRADEPLVEDTSVTKDVAKQRTSRCIIT